MVTMFQIWKGSYCCGDKTYQVSLQLNLKPHSYELLLLLLWQQRYLSNQICIWKFLTSRLICPNLVTIPCKSTELWPKECLYCSISKPVKPDSFTTKYRLIFIWSVDFGYLVGSFTWMHSKPQCILRPPTYRAHPYLLCNTKNYHQKKTKLLTLFITCVQYRGGCAVPWGISWLPWGLSWLPWGCSVPWRYSNNKRFIPQRYSWYLPRASWYPPHLSWYPHDTEHPPRYSRYPPTCIMISPTVLNTPMVLHTRYTGWLRLRATVSLFHKSDVTDSRRWRR